MATRLSQLDVSVLEQPVGELRHTHSRADSTPYRFTYRAGLPDRLSAALNMPTAERDYATADVPAPFEQSLPEMNIAIFPTAIWKFVLRDKMGLLWASSRRRIGRVRFHSDALDERQQPSSVRISASELGAVKDGDALFLDAVNALRDIPGVAGIQPKVLVSIEEPSADDGRDSPEDVPVHARTIGTDSHILKANHPDYLGATIVESLCLDLAEKVGLPTPERLLSGDGRLLAVKRFDLMDDGRVYGFDEVGAVLGRTAEHKYEGSLEEVASIVREFSGADHRIESLRQLFALCVLNNAVRNGDGHLKNFGLIYDMPADAKLSPVYDVLTTTSFERLRNDAPALTLNGRKQWDDFDSLLHFGQTACLMNKVQMRGVIEATVAAMRELLPQIQAAREKYPYASGTLWVMRVEWLESIEIMERHLR